MFTSVREFLKLTKYIDVKKLWIIPLAPNSKRPVSGYKWTENRITVNQAIQLLSRGYNIAFVSKKNGLCFIDIDNPKLLSKLHSPPTLVVKTPHGGYHLYYYNDLMLESNVFADGIEFRMHNAYVVGAGSCIDSKVYEIVYATKPAKISNVRLLNYDMLLQ